MIENSKSLHENGRLDLEELESAAESAFWELYKLTPFLVFSAGIRIGLIGLLFFLISTELPVPKAFLIGLIVFAILEFLDLVQFRSHLFHMGYRLW